LPVLRDDRSVGSIHEVTLARVLHDSRDPHQVMVSEIMASPLPQVDIEVQLDEAYRLLLAGNTGVLATLGGKVRDIITRIDLIHYWNQNRSSGCPKWLDHNELGKDSGERNPIRLHEYRHRNAVTRTNPVVIR